MQAWPKQYKTRLNALPLVHANNFHVIPCSKVLGVIARVLIHLPLAPTHAPDKIIIIIIKFNRMFNIIELSVNAFKKKLQRRI
jgi:hypothetical protein